MSPTFPRSLPEFVRMFPDDSACGLYLEDVKMKTRGLKQAPPPGTKVRLTGYFLKCTGQVTGGEGQSRWTVVACACGLCKTGDYLATDEPNGYTEADGYTAAELAEPGMQWRHIAIGNLQIVGAPPRAADQPEECPPVKDLLGHWVGKAGAS